MDVDRQTNLPEERTSQGRSFCSFYRRDSQSRKISIGVLVDSVSKAETKDIKEAVMQNAENETFSKGDCAKDHERHTPVVEKHVTVSQKDRSPWVSTRSFNPKISSSVAVPDTEHAPSFLATSRTRRRSKLLEKASTAHSVKFFAGNLESGECRQKNFGKVTHSMEAGKVNNVEQVENLVFSTEPGVLREKEQVEDKDGKAETGGRETLRMKLWDILGAVSSPKKHCASTQSVELHRFQERDAKQSPIEKRDPNSDTIESDSEMHTFRRPTTRSLTRKKASTKRQHNKAKATKSTCHRKECPRKRIFSSKGVRCGRLYDNLNDGSLPSKKNKTERESTRVETHQGHKYENAEQRQQSENKSRSIPAVQKSMEHGNVVNANSLNDRRNDILLEPKSCTKENNSFESSLNVTTKQQKDVEQPMDVEISLKDQQEDIADSLLKNKRNPVHDPSTPTLEIKSPGCSPKSKQGKLNGQNPAEKIFNTKGIRNFKSLLRSKSDDCEQDVQVESSDGRCELNDSPLTKPSFIMEEDSENRTSKLSTDTTDSESSKDDSHMKDCKESEQLSPEISEKFLRDPYKCLENKKDVEVIGCSPLSESLKGIQDGSELQTYLEQNREDGLASAVALFTVALDRVKTKLKSLSSKRSAEILGAAAEEIFLLLQNAESQIKTDVGKLTNLSRSKRKQLEPRLEEQQEQLLGIYRRFKDEVDRHLQDYGGIIEELEVHEIEFKRTVERQRSAHKRLLSQVEQEIKVQLNDTENRIMAFQELAREKMLQLKLAVAESLKHGAFG